MKIEKAIEVLTQLSEPGIAVWDAEDINAIKLGKEALKLYRHNRIIGAHHDPDHLSGETKD